VQEAPGRPALAPPGLLESSTASADTGRARERGARARVCVRRGSRGTGHRAPRGVLGIAARRSGSRGRA